MIRGLYTAASGMLVQSIRNDVVANNLANVDTVGFKRDRTLTSAFPEMLLRRINDQAGPIPLPVATAPRIGALGTGVALEGTYADMQAGPLQHTGRDLDVALVSDGFLAVENGDALAYTRDGRLQINAQGMLTDSQGRAVMGMDGPIELHSPDEGAPSAIEIRTDGVIEVDGEVVGQLALYQFEQPAFMQRLGDNLWQATEHSGEVAINGASVERGHLERSNVNVVSEMVTMIQVQRAYEASQRVIQAHDQVLERAVNDIAAV